MIKEDKVVVLKLQPRVPHIMGERDGRCLNEKGAMTMTKRSNWDKVRSQAQVRRYGSEDIAGATTFGTGRPKRRPPNKAMMRAECDRMFAEYSRRMSATAASSL